jgi:hypothetical protein
VAQCWSLSKEIVLLSEAKDLLFDGGERFTTCAPISPAKPYHELPRPIKSSIVEPKPHLDKDLAWVIPVEASERLAVVEFYATVGYVQSI